MSFITPRLFPGPFCWEECPEGVDPLQIFDGSPTTGLRAIYPFGCTLKQIMELYWINQIFDVVGNVSLSDSFGTEINNVIATTNSSYAIAGENIWGNKNKMSEILCPDGLHIQQTRGTINGAEAVVSTLVLRTSFKSFQTLADYRILRKKTIADDIWYPLFGASLGSAGFGFGTFPYSDPATYTEQVECTINFSDGSSIKTLAINVSQAPGSSIKGSINISIQKRRENS